FSIKFFQISGIFQQLLPELFSSLYPILTVSKPGSAFFYNTKFKTQVNEVAGFTDTFIIKNIKLNLFKRRSNFTFNYFNFGSVADNVFTLFNGCYSSDIYSYR